MQVLADHSETITVEMRNYNIKIRPIIGAHETVLKPENW